jgi:hypothetical protein
MLFQAIIKEITETKFKPYPPPPVPYLAYISIIFAQKNKIFELKKAIYFKVKKLSNKMI